MASEFAEARTKTITENLINSVLDNLRDEGLDGTKRTAYDWWRRHKVELIGLSIAEVSAILRNARDKKQLVKKYDELVASMSWKERLEFLKGGLSQLRRSNSKKIRTATIIATILEIAPKVLPIILMVL